MSVLLLRPASNMGRHVVCGYRVDEEILPHGGVELATKEEAEGICKHLAGLGIREWTWRPKEAPVTVQEPEPEPVPAPTADKPAFVPRQQYFDLQGCVRDVMKAGGPPVKLNSQAHVLMTYLEKYGKRAQKEKQKQEEEEPLENGAGVHDSRNGDAPSP